MGRGYSRSVSINKYLLSAPCGTTLHNSLKPFSCSPALLARADPASPHQDAEGGCRVYTGRR